MADVDGLQALDEPRHADEHVLVERLVAVDDDGGAVGSGSVGRSVAVDDPARVLDAERKVRERYGQRQLETGTGPAEARQLAGAANEVAAPLVRPRFVELNPEPACEE